MLALCAMIAGCTSVSAVDYSTKPQEEMNGTLGKRINRFVEETQSEGPKMIQKLKNQTFELNLQSLNNADEIKKIGNFVSSLDQFTQFIKERSNIASDLYENLLVSDSKLSNKYFFSMNRALVKVADDLCVALGVINDVDIPKGDYGYATLGGMANQLTFRENPNKIIGEIFAAEKDTDFNYANKKIEELNYKLNRINFFIRLIRASMESI